MCVARESVAMCVLLPGEAGDEDEWEVGDEDAGEKQEEQDLFLSEFRQQKDGYYREKLHLEQITP